MPEHIRALIIILGLSIPTFFLMKRMTASVISSEQFNRWSMTWISVTLIAFLSGNFWVYVLLTGLLLLYVGKKEQNPFALFFMLLFTIPRINQNIPGFGLVNFLFSVDYVTVLSLTILLPAYLSLRKLPDIKPFLSYTTDKILLVYLVLDTMLLIRGTTFTDVMRSAVFNYTDVFLPYYVASRSIRNLQQLKEVIIALVLASMLAGVIALYEYAQFWLLYAQLAPALGVTWDLGLYLNRGENLRALASLGQPIVLGYALMVALGCYFYMAKTVNNKLLMIIGFCLLIGGLYAPLSRGPWVGAALLVIFFIAISPKAIRHFTILFVTLLALIPIVKDTPMGIKIADMLPFIGKVDIENVEYRMDLVDNTIILFNRNPFFGSVTYLQDLADLGMVQGAGIVDVVNSYLASVLRNGLVGVTLFIVFFGIILASVTKSLIRIPDKNSDIHLLGRVILSCIVAMLVTIISVSSILIIPILYWTFAGLGLSFSRLVKGYKTQDYEVELLPTIRLANKS